MRMIGAKFRREWHGLRGGPPSQCDAQRQPDGAHFPFCGKNAYHKQRQTAHVAALITMGWREPALRSPGNLLDHPVRCQLRPPARESELEEDESDNALDASEGSMSSRTTWYYGPPRNEETCHGSAPGPNAHALAPLRRGLHAEQSVRAASAVPSPVRFHGGVRSDA